MKTTEELLQEAEDLTFNYFHSDLYADSLIEEINNRDINEELKEKYNLHRLLIDLKFIRQGR